MLTTNITEKDNVFLVDTQADISVLKESCIKYADEINNDEIIDIRGVTEGITESLGTVATEIIHDGFEIDQTFHVVPDEFNIGADGILGKDFLKKYRCNISYENMLITFQNGNDTIEIPLHGGPDEDTIILPARCEVARQIRIQTCVKGGRLIDSQQIADGVFIAKTIIDTKKPIVRIINTTSKVQILKLGAVKTESLENFKIYTIDEVKRTKQRTKLLITELESHTPKQHRSKIIPLCREFNDIFAMEEDKLSVNNFYTQKFRVKDDTPVYVKNYRLPYSQREEVNQQVGKLLQNDLIEPSCAEYNSPILLVPKKGIGKTKKWRLCIDYRLVNKKLIADKYPLPRIEDILDSLGRARFFSIIDLFSGFHQIPIDEESRDITSFSTTEGSFRWKVVPFGLNVSPNSFSRMMAIAFSGIPAGTAFLYIDDIIVTGCSEAHHMKNLRTVFETLRKYNLKINPYKCQFFKKEVVFLGHRCTEEGISPDSEKLKTLENYPEPNDKDSVKRFVAFANYYRKFVKNFATLAQPLNHLTRKSTIFRWGEESKKAFTAIKNALSRPTVLAYPDFNKEFTLTVDACMTGCGAVLSQIQDDGTDRPISFASRAFNKTERNKPIIELELLGIFYGITYFKPYLYGTEFLVRTDHKPLIYLFSLTNPTQRLLRIRLELEEFTFNIEYIRGKDNVVADALSRMSMDEIKECNQNVARINVTTRSMTRKANKTRKDEKEEEEIINLTVYEDHNIKFHKRIPKIVVKNKTLEARMNGKSLFKIDLSALIRDGKLALVQLFSHLQLKANEMKIGTFHLSLDSALFNYCTIENFKEAGQNVMKSTIILTSEIKRVESEDEKRELLERYHNDKLLGGHSGRNRLYAKLRSKFYWKGLSRDVSNLVKKCPQCQLNKIQSHTREKMEITKTPQKPFDTVIIDTIGPLNESIYGNKYAVTLICDLTKHLTIIPIKNKEAKTIARAIVEEFILIYGVMKNTRTDLGTEYNNQIFNELSKLLDIQNNFSTAYHHQTVGTIERNHRVLNAYLRSYLLENRNDWDVYAKYFQFCYNTTPNSSLNHRYTPFELIFGHKANFPSETFESIEPIYNIDNYVNELKFRLQKTHEKSREILTKYKERMKAQYDKRVEELEIKIGDEIKIRDEAGHKLEPLYRGPFTVDSIEGKNVIAFDKSGKKIKVHKNRVKIYNS